MAIDVTKLIDDLKHGHALAKTAAAAETDGGTCNFDSPVFYFERSPSAKERALYEAALNAVGLSFFWAGDMFGKGKNRRLVFGPGCGGQAVTRTVGAEAFAKYLTGAGWPNVSVYYQMD